MKKLLTFLFFSCLILSSNAQVVSISPVFAQQTDSVTIIFDASLGNGALVNAVPVYAHTGVITNNSTSPTDWQHVQGNWGVHDPQVIMTSLGNNKHQISFKINDFYQLGPNDTVLALAFVFRNGSGSVVGREADGSDIFIPIYPPGFSVNILQPQPNELQAATNQFLFEVACSDTAQISLFIDGAPLGNTVNSTVASQNIDCIQYASGAHTLHYEVVKNGTTYQDSTHFYIYGAPVIANPPQGTTDGINIISNSSVVLQLLAPEKEFVFAVGDFNNWQFDNNYFMHLTPDSLRYWVQIDNLDPNALYRFQYHIGPEGLRVPDIYSNLILNPWDDPYIPGSTYPNLPDYPTDTTQGNVSTFQINTPNFSWKNDGYSAPNKENLVIYELLIRDFVAQHDYQTVIDSLSYLSNLGINAIELMPINEFEGNESWGYNPSFYFAPDKYYGPSADFKAFVDSCHGRGIAVILDIALNHSFGQNPQVQMYFDANAGQWGQPAPNNPWFNEIPKHDFNVGYDYNHESPHTKTFSKRVLNYWVDEFHIDGYRMDLSKGFTQTNTLGNSNAMAQYDQSRIDILQDYAQAVWNNQPQTIFILEHFADNQEETVLANSGFLIWGNLNHEYNEATMGYPSDFNWASYKSRSWNNPHLVSYSSSHDEERLMYKNQEYGNSNGNYNVKDFATGISRVEAANVMLYTIPGPKMIWQFDEIGYDYSINYCPDGTIDPGCRVANKPIRWDYTTDSARVHLYNVTRELFILKKTQPVFSTSNFSMNVNGFQKRIVLQHSSMNAVALANFDVSSGSISGNFPHTGTWYEFFSGDSIQVTSSSQPIAISAGGYFLFTDVKLATPNLNRPISTSMPLAIQNTTPEAHSRVKLYPNPATDFITIETTITHAVMEYELFNLQGQRVLKGRMNSTNHTVHIPPHFKNGMYVLRVIQGNQSTAHVISVAH